MSRRVVFIAASCACCLGMLYRIAVAADYAGSFDGAGISVVISPSGTGFGGEIRKGGQAFPLQAHEDGDHLSGAFTAAGKSFDFTATRKGDDLTLLTGTTTYQLHLHPDAPHDAAAASQPADPLAKYVVMNNTDVGRSLVREIPNATTTLAAIQATFPDLANHFGARPTVLGAYEDQRDHKSAFVSFSTQLNGQAVKGFVTTKLRDQGAVVFVVFGKADATPAQWAALTAPPKPAVQARLPRTRWILRSKWLQSR